MRWVDVLAQVATVSTSGSRAIDVRGVQYDSRRVSAGDVFVAMRGGTSDGNQFIDAAIRKGAAAIVTDTPKVFDELQEKQPELALALAEHGRRALAEVSSAVFGRPQDKLKVSAVTGTNGKTTTGFLLEQMLRSVGRKCLLIGTIETHIGDEVRPSEHTTPESRDILAFFAEAVRTGCTEAVMEMSSHALEQERVWGIQVDVAIFTNLTQDHLDYHQTMDKYAAAKARLFAGVGAPPPRVAVINADDSFADAMMKSFDPDNRLTFETKPNADSRQLFTYGIESSRATHSAFQLKASATGTIFSFDTPIDRLTVESPLAGRVNVSNLLAAMCAALARGLTFDEVVSAAPQLTSVPGRFEVVPASRVSGFTVVVDYAHTDDALRNLITLARNLVKHTGGQVITMFGCGGDRDRTKRPKMGRVAGEGSDWVVLTSDNPRSEHPSRILAEVLAGVRETDTNFVVEPDRRVAIAAAIRLAKQGDLVLLAGKGHEKTQILADGAVPFDDVAEAERVLRELRIES